MPNLELAQAAIKPATSSMLSPRGTASVHLDALRGFAAFSVLLNHWRDALFVDYSELHHPNPLVTGAYLTARLGHQWVIVFFVLSGYLVGGSVLHTVSSGHWSWRKYLFQRLTRLYIVLLPALILGGAADWAGMHMHGTDAVYSGKAGMHDLESDVHATLNLPTLAANSVFLQTIVPPANGGRAIPTLGTNRPLWSLCNEFWYYLAFPLLVLAAIRMQSWQVRVCYALALILLGWFVGVPILLLGIPWLMGVAVPFLPRPPTLPPLGRAAAIAGAMMLVGAGLVYGKFHYSLSADIVIGLLVTGLIWVTLHCAPKSLPSWYVWLSQRAAHSSYTLYLIHVPILILLKASLNLPRSAPSGPALLVNIAVLIVIVIYAQLVYELFEKNTDRLRNWIRSSVMSKEQTA
jgi:peptidoglycan/LPS O-acetylase OafA/YrhL